MPLARTSSLWLVTTPTIPYWLALTHLSIDVPCLTPEKVFGYITHDLVTFCSHSTIK